MKKVKKSNGAFQEVATNPATDASFLAAIVESSDDAIIGKTMDGAIISWNKGAERLYGYAAKEAIGKPMSFIIPKERADELPRFLSMIKKGEPVAHYETQRLRKDGVLIDISVSLSPVRDASGNVIGAAAIARSITERKQAALYARSLIEASLDPLVTISPEGKITDVNEATIRITGVPREQLIGTDFSNYFTEPEIARAGYQQVFKKRSVTDYALTVRRKDGRKIDVLYNASVYKDDKGNVLGVFAAARDVTATKQASLYARSLIEASLDPLVTINPEGKVTDVNEGSVKATGVTKEKLIGTDFSTYFTEPTKASEGYQRVFKEGFITDYPLTIKHKDGKKLTDVLYNASVYKDEKGNVLGVFAAARDYTRVKQTTEQVETTNKELETFSYSVSHDLRAPLRAIDGFAKVLVEEYGGKIDQEGKRIISVIQKNSEQMGKLIDDLLSFSRLGRQEIKKDYISMNPLVREIFNGLMESQPKRKIEFNVQELSDSRVDSDMIRLVWTNLLSNAIKFTKPKEKAVIEVGSKTERDKIIYYVKDNGAGFDMKYVDNLFNVFQRLHSADEFEGTGVGLANVKRIVERHGGKVWAEGKVDEGATFYFTLPKV